MPGSPRQITTLDPTPSVNDMMFGAPQAMWGAFPLPTLPGSTLLAFTNIANLTGKTITSLSDAINGTWPAALERLSNPSSGCDNALWCLQNAASIPAGAFGRASSAGSTTSLTDSSKSGVWTLNQFAGAYFRNVTTGVEGTVASNTTTGVLTFSPALSGAVANGDTYVVGGWIKAIASAFDDYHAFTIMEVQDVAAASLIDHSSLSTTTAGPGTNDVSTGSKALGSAPATIVCFALDDVDNNTTYVPLADTSASCTNDGANWVWNLGQPIMRVEHYNLTNPGTFAGKFSSQAVGGDHHNAFMVALRDAATAPTAGTLALTGGASILNTGIKVSTASLGLTGIASAILPGVAPQMLQGVLSLIGNAPQLALGIILTSAGSLGLVGAPPTVSRGNITLIPSTGSAQLAGTAPNVRPGNVPLVGSIGLTGAAPILGLNIVMSGVTTGSLSFSSDVPRVGAGIIPAVGTIVLTAVNLRSPVIAPSAGVVAFGGTAPTANQSAPIILPPTGSLALQSALPNLTLSVPAPPTANLVFGGNYPQLLLQYFITPATGAIQVVGNSLGGQVTNVQVTAGTGQMLVPGAPPKLDTALNVPAGALTTPGQAPGRSIGTALLPATGTLTFTGTTPLFAGGVGLAPVTGALAFTGTTPALLPANVVATGTLAFGGQTSILGLGIIPPVGALAFSGASSTVNGQTIIAPPVGTLALSGSIPRQSYFRLPTVGVVSLSTAPISMNLGIAPLAGSMAMSGVASIAAQSGLPLTLTGTLALTGGAAGLNLGIAPPAGSLALGSVLPRVNSLTTLTPPAGTIVFASTSQGVLQVGVIVPPTGNISLQGNSPPLARAGFAAPGTVSLGLQGRTPLVYQTINGFITPDTANMALLGQPAVNSLYTEDNPLVVILAGPVDFVVVL